MTPIELVIVQITITVATLLALVVVYSLKSMLCISPHSPHQLLPILREKIQSHGFECSEEKPTVLRVRKDSFVRVKIHLKALNKGTKVLFQTDTTELGWVLVFMLLFLPALGWVGILVAFYIHFSGKAFSRRVIRRLLPLSLEKYMVRRGGTRGHILKR
ncbi:MAG: hypothetical protein ACE5KV_04355 [Thermoplasmata archaeon]